MARGGGDTDLGDPVYATGDGIVSWAYDVHVGWGNVVMIRHAYRDPATGQLKFCDSLYGHLNEIKVKVGQIVKRGDQIGTIGTNHGMYPAHLHFEIRNNINIGMQRESVNRDYANWAVPSDFIKKYRRLNREWGKALAPTGTYQDYQGFKGLLILRNRSWGILPQSVRGASRPSAFLIYGRRRRWLRAGLPRIDGFPD